MSWKSTGRERERCLGTESQKWSWRLEKNVRGKGTVMEVYKMDYMKEERGVCVRMDMLSGVDDCVILQ